MMATLLDLTKSLELNLQKQNFFQVPKMAVKIAVDKSGSMDDEFRSGWVQDTIDLFLAAAMKFDDDGKMEIGFFNTDFERTPDVTAEDNEKYIRKHGIYAGGGTNFAGAIRSLGEREKSGGFFGFGGKVDTSKKQYIALITDGDNGDKAEFERALDSLENTFVQIVAIGNGVPETYLKRVAQKPNVEVVFLRNPKGVSVDQFYEMLLNEDLKQFCEK